MLSRQSYLGLETTGWASSCIIPLSRIGLSDGNDLPVRRAAQR